MRHLLLKIGLTGALALVLAACGNGADQLEPEAENGAPTYEQLNPPVEPSNNSSMAPATPDNEGETVEMPLGPGRDESIATPAPGDTVTAP